MVQRIRRHRKYFLSHSGDDKAVALCVARLLHQHQRAFWLDVLDIQEENRPAIFPAIQKCDCFVAIVSEQYLHSEWCTMERGHACGLVESWSNKMRIMLGLKHKEIVCLRIQLPPDSSGTTMYLKNLFGTSTRSFRSGNNNRVEAIAEEIYEFFQKCVGIWLSNQEMDDIRQGIEYLESLENELSYREMCRFVGVDAHVPAGVGDSRVFDIEQTDGDDDDDDDKSDALVSNHSRREYRKKVARLAFVILVVVISIIGVAVGVVLQRNNNSSSDQPKSSSLQENDVPDSSSTSVSSSQPTPDPSFAPSTHLTVPTPKEDIVLSSETTQTPSSIPSVHSPSSFPTWSPSNPRPTVAPVLRSSRIPTTTPTWKPSNQPSNRPSFVPSTIPSSHPSHQPSQSPSGMPSQKPTPRSQVPSLGPSMAPSLSSSQPSTRPTDSPSLTPSLRSKVPSFAPSVAPSLSSNKPSSRPTDMPSITPSFSPTLVPSSQPTASPASNLKAETNSPSLSSTNSISPSLLPSELPSPGLPEYAVSIVMRLTLLGSTENVAGYDSTLKEGETEQHPERGGERATTTLVSIDQDTDTALVDFRHLFEFNSGTGTTFSCDFDFGGVQVPIGMGLTNWISRECQGTTLWFFPTTMTVEIRESVDLV